MSKRKSKSEILSITNDLDAVIEKMEKAGCSSAAEMLTIFSFVFLMITPFTTKEEMQAISMLTGCDSNVLMKNSKEWFSHLLRLTMKSQIRKQLKS